ncbi:hypothetical protein PHMEG_00037868 [Phytophthora megakarya]|uniref:Uncharacterized protein n=1 Tax=Phytophthora megakarya TaxID=4795 RepID=A0A225UIU9_9STRA|nr:hypothetical protein PHMEG_00037868 [Phytophthora megakarya]
MGNLSNAQRECIIQELLGRSIDNKLPRGAKAYVARQFKCQPPAKKLEETSTRYHTCRKESCDGKGCCLEFLDVIERCMNARVIF